MSDNHLHSPLRIALRVVLAVTVLLLAPLPVVAQENADCLMCHEDRELAGTRDGQPLSVFVDATALAASVHADLDCVACHADLAGAELPHAEELARVDCATCHDEVPRQLARSPHASKVSCSACHGSHDVVSPRSPSAATNDAHVRTLCGKCHPDQAAQHLRSLHGRAAASGDRLAPSCVTCHNHHDVLAHTDPSSRTNTLGIPLLCGTCHHEGTPVSIEHNIPQERILENYSESIHSEGLYKKGLTVTAVCTSCHTSHEILEHTDPRSSINRANVARTCTACHARIEAVHVKVIEGKLWESEAHKIPSCVECHSPHKIRRPSTQPGAANQDCLACHARPNLTMVRAGQTISLYVDPEQYALSSHSGTACAQCHNDVTLSRNRPCETVQGKVDCGICHADQVGQYNVSTHGTLAAKGDPDAPLCLDCHEKHATRSHRLPNARTYPRNVPELCGSCHRRGGKAAARIVSDIPDIVQSYEESVHGKGLMESGLVVSATCTGCHTAHRVLPAADPESTVNRARLVDTCGVCHHGIEETFKTSVHWTADVTADHKLPVCEDCHTSHTISRIDARGFRFAMLQQCGNCHRTESDTFFDTYHGKVSRLGAEGSAKCYDCHGTHDILPPSDPASHLSRKNVVATCAKCHPGAHRRFAGYLTHATHHDQHKYPWLFYSFWFMTLLLVGTLTFAIVHTLAWLWRLWRTREQWRVYKHAPAERFYLRFERGQRAMHLVMLLSFFTLALTGMALKFSYMGWAQALSNLFGGFETMGTLHRIGAVTLIGLFLYHLAQVRRMKRESGKPWLRFIFGPDSILFNSNDVRQVFGSVKWFLGKGPRPHYGRFTYWEKFDYFAVFWGVLVIGSTGLVLWFPELFTRVIPGAALNVATIIHSDEALLAVGFIFTVHFFNTHFRPDKFPMDPVIFTGRVPLPELAHDKPAEYEQLLAGRTESEVEGELVGPAPPRFERTARIFGFTALAVGLTLIALIVFTMVFGYR